MPKPSAPFPRRAPRKAGASISKAGPLGSSREVPPATFKRARAPVDGSAARLRAQYKGLPVPTYTWQRFKDDFRLIDFNDLANTMLGGRLRASLGALASEFYKDQPEIPSDLAGCFATRTQRKHEITYRLPSTGEMRRLVCYYVYIAPDLVTLHTEDVTTRRGHEAGLARRNRELLGLNRVAAALSSSLDVDKVLQTIAGQALELTEADRAIIAERSPFADEYAVRVAVARDPSEQWEGVVFPARSISGWVSHHREILNLPDLREHPWYLNHEYPKGGALAALFVPLLRGEEYLGELSLSRGSEAPFAAAEEELVRNFASHAAIALYNARLFQETQDRLRHASAIAVVSAYLQELNLDPVLLVNRALEQIARALGVDLVGVNLLQDDDHFQVTQTWGASPRPKEPLPMTDSLRNMLRTREPIVRDPHHSPPLEPAGRVRAEQQRVGAIITAPLVAGEHALGMISVAHRSPHLWTESEKQTILTIANQLAAAVANSRQYNEKVTRLGELEALQELTKACSASLDRKEIMLVGLQKAQQLVKAKSAIIRTLEGKYLLPGAYIGPEGNVLLAEPIEVGPEHELLLREGREVIVSSLDDPQVTLRWRKSLLGHGARRTLLLPLRTFQQVTGYFAFTSDSPEPWRTEELDLARTIANIIAIALKNAEQYERLAHRAAALASLAALSLQLASTLDQGEIIRMTCEAAVSVLASPYASIRLVVGETLGESYGVSPAGSAVSPEAVPFTHRLEAALRERQPIVIPDIMEADTSPMQRPRVTDLGARAYLGVPMQAGRDALGILSVMRKEVHAWTPEEISLASTVGNLCALALVKASAHHEIWSEHDRLQAVLNSMQTGLFMTDAEGNITRWNDAAATISGWRPELVVALKKWGDLFQTAAGSPSSILAETLAIDANRFKPVGHFLQTVERGPVSVGLGLAPLHDGAGNVKGVVGTFMDLSELEELERARQSFLTTVTHELLTPLTIILAGIDFLQTPHLTLAEKEKIFTLMRGQSQRLRSFSEKFVHFDQLANPERVHIVALDLGPFVRRAVEQFKSMHREHHFTFANRARGARALADAERLERVLYNLLDNAIKYSPPGTAIRTSLQADSESITIAIADEGIGIPLAEQERIFERWHRAHVSSAQRAYGHGIGLWLVRTNVQAMGGDVRAASDEEHGSTFTVRLRRALQE